MIELFMKWWFWMIIGIIILEIIESILKFKIYLLKRRYKNEK